MNSKEEMMEKCIKVLSKELPILRRMNGYTQEKLAEIIGVSRQTITNIECGKTEMRWIQFLAILLVFLEQEKTSAYIRELDIPFEDVRKWMSNRAI